MAQAARSAANDPNFSAFVRGLGGLDGVETFVRAQYAYRDEVEEIVRTPQFMLADMGRLEGSRIVGLEGDCDDVSTFFAGCCAALGYRSRFVAIRYTPTNPYFEHVFTQAYDGGNWRTLDATVPPGTSLNWLEEMIQEVR